MRWKKKTRINRNQENALDNCLTLCYIAPSDKIISRDVNSSIRVHRKCVRHRLLEETTYFWREKQNNLENCCTLWILSLQVFTEKLIVRNSQHPVSLLAWYLHIVMQNVVNFLVVFLSSVWLLQYHDVSNISPWRNSS